MNIYPVWAGDFANTLPEKTLREENRKITEAGGASGGSPLTAGQREQAAPRSAPSGVVRAGQGYGAAGKNILFCGKWVVQGLLFGTASVGVGKERPAERLGWNLIEICGCDRYLLRVNDLSLYFIVGLTL